MPRPPLPESERKSSQLVLRVEPELVTRLDRYLTALGQRTPWTRPSRADAVRALLHEALANFEGSTVLTDELRSMVALEADRRAQPPGAVLAAAIAGHCCRKERPRSTGRKREQ